MIPGLDGGSADDLQIHARDRQGVYARLAAVLDPRVGRVEQVGGLTSFEAWIRPRCFDDRDAKELILPGVLEYFDLPDIDRWLGARCVPGKSNPS